MKRIHNDRFCPGALPQRCEGQLRKTEQLLGTDGDGSVPVACVMFFVSI